MFLNFVTKFQQPGIFLKISKKTHKKTLKVSILCVSIEKKNNVMFNKPHPFHPENSNGIYLLKVCLKKKLKIYCVPTSSERIASCIY